MVLCVAHAMLLPAQQRPAVIQSIDLSVPQRPATVRIDDRTHLVYELHVSNFLRLPVVITRVTVKSADSSGATLADYQRDELARLVSRPGVEREQSPLVIGPGLRAVANFWIALAPGSVVPRAVRHSAAVDVQRQSGSVQATVDGAVSIVSNEAAVVLDAPLRGGPWVAIYDPLLMGGHRTAFYTLGGRARIPGRFAIDWIRLRSSGVIDKATPQLADWNGYGADVLAVADGTVARALDDILDNVGEPGAAAHAPENASGNYVAIDIGRGRFAFYEHLAHGSIAVKVGDRVRSGQVIAKLGNSGSSSIGPHLHFHVSDANSPLAAEGLPFVLRRFDHLGGFPSIAALVGGEKWIANRPGRESARQGERPVANAVIHFRP